jgi:hypothetical protein
MHLQAHPHSSPGPVHRIEVRAWRTPADNLDIGWRLEGDVNAVQLPSAGTPSRTDGLWRHTCFEAFVARPGDPGYRELNFSPGGEWAAYAFTGYRAGMTPLELHDVPVARWHRSGSELRLDLQLPVAELLPGPGHAPLRLALAAVVEDQAGMLTYWALRHPDGPPDFHAAAGFVLELPASHPA